MKSRMIGSCVAIVVILGGTLVAQNVSAPSGDAKSVAEIRAFNDKFTDAHLRMDSTAILGFWAEDGVTLLPGMEPVVGKPAIQKFLTNAFAGAKGSKMLKQEDDFHDIAVSGDWASEWAITHQVIQPPDGKPAMDITGKMLLVLHREKDGQWKVEREAWNR